MRRGTSVITSGLIAIASLACGDGGAPAPAPDAAVSAATDAGTATTPAPDGGALADANDVTTTPDTGRTPDAATTPDSGAPNADAGATPAPDAATSPRDAGVLADSGLSTIGETCFSDIYVPNIRGPNYDQFHPTVGSHCFGTNHQQIDRIERVVFLGDSVTVGTPPTPTAEYYRNRLADRLTQRFGLDAPGELWRRASLFDGQSIQKFSGDFASCAKWGARTDDLLGPNKQIEQCFPQEELGKRTLVIMTIGGNDISHLTKAGAQSTQPPRTLAQLQAETEQFVRLLREAIVWLKTPGRFPNGVFVVYTNPPEFTDGTGEIESCGLSTIAGFNDPWANPQDLENLVIWALEQYMQIAIDTQSDLIWMLEHFCGHGFVATGPNADPNNRCYRGPMAERWFDISCIHPNPTGHGVLADMFFSAITE